MIKIPMVFGENLFCNGVWTSKGFTFGSTHHPFQCIKHSWFPLPPLHSSFDVQSDRHEAPGDPRKPEDSPGVFIKTKTGHTQLVGGWTNPSAKYARQNGFIFPKIGMNIKKIIETTD